MDYLNDEFDPNFYTKITKVKPRLSGSEKILKSKLHKWAMTIFGFSVYDIGEVTDEYIISIIKKLKEISGYDDNFTHDECRILVKEYFPVGEDENQCEINNHTMFLYNLITNLIIKPPEIEIIKRESQECGVCLENCVNFSHLSCGHEFCNTCIDRIFSITKQIICPTCRAITKVSYYSDESKFIRPLMINQINMIVRHADNLLTTYCNRGKKTNSRDRFFSDHLAVAALIEAACDLGYEQFSIFEYKATSRLRAMLTFDGDAERVMEIPNYLHFEEEM